MAAASTTRQRPSEPSDPGSGAGQPVLERASRVDPDRLEPEEIPTDIDEAPQAAARAVPAAAITRRVSMIELNYSREPLRSERILEFGCGQLADLDALDQTTDPLDQTTDPLDQTTDRDLHPAGAAVEPLDDDPTPPTAAAYPTTRYGPLLGRGAPDLVRAVERFIAAANPARPPVFTGLLGDGPSVRSTQRRHPPSPAKEREAAKDRSAGAHSAEPRRVMSAALAADGGPNRRSREGSARPQGGACSHHPSERRGIVCASMRSPIEDGLEVATPPVSPRARLRLVPDWSLADARVTVEQHPKRPPAGGSPRSARPLSLWPSLPRQPGGDARHPGIGPSMLDDPGLRLRQAVTAVGEPRVIVEQDDPDDSPAHDLFPPYDAFPPAPAPQGASGFGGSIPLGKLEVAVSPPESSRQEAPTMVAKRAVGQVASSRAPDATRLPRSWPLWFAATLLLLATVVVGGLLIARQRQAEQHLQEARNLAHTHQARHLRAALYRAKAAANLEGRTAEVLALAAAIHAQLAVEHGESDLSATSKLIEQASRLGATFHPGAAADLARANAYVVVATRTLPQTTAYLRETHQRYPENATIGRLYADALLREGQTDRAAKLLHQMPADDAGVLCSLGALQWRLGKQHSARAYLQAAALAGLDADQVALFLARLELVTGQAERIRLADVRDLAAASAALSRYERAWANLIVAALTARADLATSEDAVRRAERARPVADGEFSFQLARVLYRHSRSSDAMDQVMLARRHTPRDERYVALEAAVHLDMDRPARAVSLLQGIRSPSPAAQVTLARAHLRLGELSAARRALAEFAREDIVRRAVEAEILVEEGKPHQALRHLGGLPLTDEAVSLARGLAELSAGEPAAAATSLDVVLYQNPRNAVALWARGRAEIDRFDGPEARRYLEQAVKVNPHRLRFQVDLARLLVTLGAFDAARPRFVAVLERDPQNLAALAGRALTAVELDHREMVTDLYALRSSGHHNMATMLSMRRWMRADRWNQAAADLARIDARWLSDEPTGQLWQTQILRRRGEHGQATAIYRQLLRFPGTRASAQLGLSEFAFARGDLVAALHHARAAVAATRTGIYPTALQVETRLQLARCLERGEDFDGALDVLREVVKQDAQRAEAHLLLGRICSEIQEPARALEHLDRTLALQPDLTEARTLHQRACAALAPDRPASCR